MALLLWIFNKEISLESIANSLLFIRNFNVDLGRDFFPLLPPGWTINYEILFYLSLFFSIFFCQKTKYAIVLFTILMLASLFIPISYLWLELFIGSAIFTYQKRLREIISKFGFIGSFLVVLICIIIIIKNKQLSGEEIYIYQRFLFWGLPASFLFIYIGLGKAVKFLPIINFSYSIYLIHWPAMFY
jgi:exopolysaccharide production protein ExoZ